MKTNNPKKHSSSVLGAIACLVLFLILLALKVSPNAPFPKMPMFILSAPIWAPVLLLFLFAAWFCLIAILEELVNSEDKENDVDPEIFEPNPYRQF